MLIFHRLSPHGTVMTEDKKSVFYAENKWNKRRKHLCIQDKKSLKPQNDINIRRYLDLQETQQEIKGLVHDSNHSCRTFINCSRVPAADIGIEDQSRLRFVDNKKNGSHPNDEHCYRCGRYNYDKGTLVISEEEGIILDSKNLCQKCSSFPENNHLDGRAANTSSLKSCTMSQNELFIDACNKNTLFPIKFNELSSDDEIDFIKRYKNSSDNTNSVGSQVVDDETFCDMPRLERQDIFDPNIDAINNFSEDERDMCALEVETDLNNSMLDMPGNVTLKESENDTKYNNNNNNNVIIEIVSNSSSADESIHQDDHDSIISTASNIKEEPRTNDNISPEKHHFNVTLLKTSNNCYKVKDVNDDYPPVTPTSSQILSMNETDSSVKIIETKLKTSPNNVNTASVNENQAWSTHSNFEKTRKSRKYSKKRKKRNHTREFSFNKYNKFQIPLISNNEGGTEYFHNDLFNSDSDSSTGNYSNSVALSKFYPYSSHKKSENKSGRWHKPCAEINGFKTNKQRRFPCELASMGNEDHGIWLFKRVKPLSAVTEPLDFRGFKDDEILSLSVKVMYFKMNLTSLSPLSFVFHGKEVILKQRQETQECPLPEEKTTLLSPSLQSDIDSPKYMLLSPADTVERINANASQYLEQSVLDLGGMGINTPSNFTGSDIRFFPTVDTVERINTDASHHLEQSVLDVGAMNTSTPTNFASSDIRFLSSVDAVERINENTSHHLEQTMDLGAVDNSSRANFTGGGIRSRRQLFSVSPTDCSVFSKAQEDSILEISGIDCKDNCTSARVQIDYLDEQLDMVETGVQSKPLSLAACGVTSQESLLITKLARLTNSSLSSGFTHETTHLIVGDGAWRSSDYLLGIAYRVYIVTIDWVVQCLNQNTIIPPESFIPVSDEGPLKCIQHVPPPFIGMYVFFKMSLSFSNYDEYTSYELAKTLCSMGGATVILDYEKFHVFHEDTFPRFFIFEDYSQLTQNILGKCKELKLVPLSSNWVKSSICSYTAEPIVQYLGEEICQRELAFEYNIPIQLLTTHNEES